MLGVVNTNMPKVSYIKAIDLYLLVSFIFVFSSLVEYIIVLNFANCYAKRKKNKDEQSHSDEDNTHIIKSNVRDVTYFHTTRTVMGRGAILKKWEWRLHRSK